MPLKQQTFNVNFNQGLDTKTDPFQVAPGRMLRLQNSVFTTGGRLQKRNGYGNLTSLSSTSFDYLTTFQNNLVALGPAQLDSFSQGAESWVNRGTYMNTSINVQSIVRSNANQTYCDSATSTNGLVCTVFTDVGATTTYKYVITDAVTGANVTVPTTITPSSGTITGSPRVFFIKTNFVIVFSNTISATEHLKYIHINMISPHTVSTDTNITSIYTGNARLNFDGVVADNSLYLAWNGSDTTVKMIRLDAALTLSSVKSFATQTATLMSVCADTAGSAPTIYAVYYDSGTNAGKMLAVNASMVTVLAPATIFSLTGVVNITAAAVSGFISAFYEVANAYSYDATLPSNYVKKTIVNAAGTPQSTVTLARSVGLASKAFLVNNIAYVLTTYGSVYQPSYFLLNSSGNIVARLAYENGGGYLATGLPKAEVSDTIATLPYLFKDQIQAVNKTQGAANVNGVYTQTGINLALFELGAAISATAEIGQNLNMPGGFLWNYDGTQVVENNFFLWPDDLQLTTATTGGAMKAQQYFYVATYEWTDNQGNIIRSAPSIPLSADLSSASPTPIAITSAFSAGDTVLTVSSIVGLQVGQVITDTTTPGNILAGTYITAIGVSSITLSNPAVANSAAGPGDTLHTVYTCSVVVDVPTLRLTYKTANPVKIVLYRWSTAQQTYYQTTSIISPVYNSTTTDSVTITDTNADTSIIGNNILYTTGGVLENVSPPATDNVALFDSRLFMIDAEDRNKLLFSKQVIEATPIEINDSESIYVAPTTSAQGNTGQLGAIAPLDDKLILFKKNALYYISGTGPDNTGVNSQYSQPIFITATVGSENQRSIVFMPKGLMFQSDKGIWLLGRDLSTSYIGAEVEGLTNGATVVSAVNVPGTNQVRFTLDTGVTLMYDYYYSQWGTFTNVPAVSSTLYAGLHTYIDQFGAVFQETPGTYLDGNRPVLMAFTTSWLSLSGLQGYERAYEFYLLGNYISPHSMSVSVAYDYNSNPTQNTMFTPDNFTPSYGGLALWGSGPNYGGPGAREQWRINFARQKCQSFQISIDEMFDPSFGIAPGAGFTLSSLDIVYGAKAGKPRIPSANYAG